MPYDVESQHKKNKYHAAERLALLLDEDSFCMLEGGGKFEPDCYDGVLTGYGKIAGEDAFVFAQDFSTHGGAIGIKQGEKIARLIETARKAEKPVVGLYDSVGASIEEGVDGLAACGSMMRQNILSSGKILQIAVVLGPCAGAAAYSSELCDLVFSVDKIGYLFVTGPKIIKSVTGEEIGSDELGGAWMHSQKTGAAHAVFSEEKECFAAIRRLIKMLFSEEEKEFYPRSVASNGEIKDLIGSVFDEESFFEIHKNYAENIVVGFAKLCGKTVGIVANRATVKNGVLDCDSADKGARFVRLCDNLSVPVITFVDTPGYLPGKEQEQNGIVKNGAKLLYAYAEATVPKITVIVKKAYGGGYIAMGSKKIGADAVYLFPDAEIGVMGESAVLLLCKKEIEALPQERREEFIRKKRDEYKKSCTDVCRALEKGYADDIVPPNELRKRLYTDLKIFGGKITRKHHGNIPL